MMLTKLSLAAMTGMILLGASAAMAGEVKGNGAQVDANGPIGVSVST